MPSASLVALCRYRLGRTLGGRLGRAGPIAVLVVAALMGIALLRGQPYSEVRDLVEGAMRWMAWLGAGPLALSIAAAPAERDRADGVELLALIRGWTRTRLAAARVTAAIIAVAARVGPPAVVLCLLLVAVAPSRALELVALGLAAGAFSAIAAVVVGVLAAVCGHYGGRRGRGLLLAVVLLPWALSDLLSRPGWSVPGALDAAWTVLSRSAAAVVWGAP